MEENKNDIEQVKTEEEVNPEDDIYFEPSSDAEYIASAFNALAAMGILIPPLSAKLMRNESAG